LRRIDNRWQKGEGGIRLLPYPPPYRCWLTISNDPDNTTMEAWQELHSVIWERINLPFADTLFISNYNSVLANQVNLKDHPQIGCAHPHDTIHTWGDFTMSRTHCFTRDDAEEGLALLAEHGLAPRVWSDHAGFVGNLLHRATTIAAQTFKDASGNTYDNMYYTLDLIHRAGVRYIWDGEIESSIWGQDRFVSRHEWYRHCNFITVPWKKRLISVLDGRLRPLMPFLNPAYFTYRQDANSQYRPHRFPDGQKFYIFKRFGKWELADIKGLSVLLSPENIDQLISNGGTAIIYTHLGKKNVTQLLEKKHIPGKTIEAFEYISKRFQEGQINISSTSKMLDYLVLRDNIEIKGTTIDIQSDGIRFNTITGDDLASHSFGVVSTNPNFEVTVDGDPVEHQKEQVGGKIFRLSFKISQKDKVPSSPVL